MLLFKLKFLAIILIIPILVYGQNKSFRLGYKHNGFVVGNSKRTNGVRLNLWDKEAERINGINLSARSGVRKMNGMSFGLILNTDTINNGVKIAGLANRSHIMNGISVGGLITVAEKINGVGIGGLLTFADTMNGVFISGFGAFNLSSDFINVVNGLSLGMFNDAEKFNGLAAGFQSRLDTMRGISIGLVYNESKDVSGIQFGMLNQTTELRGIQIGLWNVAQNKKHFRQTPFINFDFRRRKHGRTK
jgi:hypothetical protein